MSQEASGFHVHREDMKSTVESYDTDRERIQYGMVQNILGM
jgi:hypothetical protein